MQTASKINSRVTLSKTARPRAMAELAERIGYDGRIRHVRDEQYFSWRFQNPLSEYRFLFWDNGRLDGYLVLYMKVYPPGDDEWAYIVDWDAINGNVWHDLLQAAIQWGNFNYMHLVCNLIGRYEKTSPERWISFTDKTGSATRDVRGENILVKLGQSRYNDPIGIWAAGICWTQPIGTCERFIQMRSSLGW